ncbi:MAG: hypothetical protein ACXADW_21500 [Candidatus Hodarchaeales archaeon]|jgi:hypothetical protein
MKRKQVIIPAIMIIAGLIILFSLVSNNSTILTRIYYRINYKGNIPNLDSIIEKSELFEYEKHVKYRDYPGVVHNLSRADNHHFIDREYIESLMLKIELDKQRFHLFPAYERNFIYSVRVTNESLIHLTYNNNAIIKTEYANHTEIFSTNLASWDGNSLHWVGTWYLNFTHIPFALNESTTIILSNIILVKMNLKYNQVTSFWESSYLTIVQCLFFNYDFQIMFVTIDAAEAVQ